MMIWLISKLKSWLAAAGVALAIVAGAFLYGRADGKRSAEAEVERAEASARDRARKVENEVNTLGSGDVQRRLDRWMRDK